MKRSLVVLSILALLVAAACATTPATPNVSGVVTAKEGNTITVTPNGGGAASTVNVLYGTRVVWGSGLTAGRSDLTTGQAVQVWFNEGSTTDAKRIVIGQ